MLSDFELEKLERKYFEYFLTFLTANLNPIIEGLNSRIKILNDWYEIFIKTARKEYRASDLENGAERIFHHFFASILHIPNSSPIGSDLMFEVYDAFIHIEVKTALMNNPADYKGKVNILDRQTSYYSAKGRFSPKLPSYYHPKGEKEKPCLTYVIQIIHEQAKPNIKAVKLVCIPNGQLYPHYKESIIRGGKSKGKSFRYLYSAMPYFELLTTKKEKKFRIELIYLEKGLSGKDVTTLTQIPIHFQF